MRNNLFLVILFVTLFGIGVIYANDASVKVADIENNQRSNKNRLKLKLNELSRKFSKLVGSNTKSLKGKKTSLKNKLEDTDETTEKLSLKLVDLRKKRTSTSNPFKKLRLYIAEIKTRNKLNNLLKRKQEQEELGKLEEELPIDDSPHLLPEEGSVPPYIPVVLEDLIQGTDDDKSFESVLSGENKDRSIPKYVTNEKVNEEIEEKLDQETRDEDIDEEAVVREELDDEEVSEGVDPETKYEENTEREMGEEGVTGEITEEQEEEYKKSAGIHEERINEEVTESRDRLYQETDQKLDQKLDEVEKTGDEKRADESFDENTEEKRRSTDVEAKPLKLHLVEENEQGEKSAIQETSETGSKDDSFVEKKLLEKSKSIFAKLKDVFKLKKQEAPTKLQKLLVLREELEKKLRDSKSKLSSKYYSSKLVRVEKEISKLTEDAVKAVEAAR